MSLSKKKILYFTTFLLLTGISTCMYYGANRLKKCVAATNSKLSEINAPYKVFIKDTTSGSVEDITTNYSPHHSPYTTFQYNGTKTFITRLCKLRKGLDSTLKTYDSTNKNYVATMLQVVSLNNIQIEIKEREKMDSIDKLNIYTNTRTSHIINNSPNLQYTHINTNNFIIRYNNNSTDELIAYSKNKRTNIHTILFSDKDDLYIIIIDSDNTQTVNQLLKDIFLLPNFNSSPTH